MMSVLELCIGGKISARVFSIQTLYRTGSTTLFSQKRNHRRIFSDFLSLFLHHEVSFPESAGRYLHVERMQIFATSPSATNRQATNSIQSAFWLVDFDKFTSCVSVQLPIQKKRILKSFVLRKSSDDPKDP